MDNREAFSRFLRDMASVIPRDAIALRSASAQIISKWINNKFEYPNKIIDNFVYIESSIEQSIEDKLNDAVALEKECFEAYQFHIDKFLESLRELQDII
jgi:hypothetical protein